MITLCAFCNGTGVQPHSLKMACISCRGKGKVEFEHAAAICSACKGSGRASDSSVLSCIQCRGVGMVEKLPEGKGTGDIVKDILEGIDFIHIDEKKTWNSVKCILRRTVEGLAGAGRWTKNRLIKETLWFKTMIYKIKQHS